MAGLNKKVSKKRPVGSLPIHIILCLYKKKIFINLVFTKYRVTVSTKKMCQKLLSVLEEFMLQIKQSLVCVEGTGGTLR